MSTPEGKLCTVLVCHEVATHTITGEDDQLLAYLCDLDYRTYNYAVRQAHESQTDEDYRKLVGFITTCSAWKEDEKS